MTDTTVKKYKIDISMPKELYENFVAHMRKKQDEHTEDGLIINKSKWICGAIHTKLINEKALAIGQKEKIVEQTRAAEPAAVSVPPFGLNPDDPDYIDKLADNLLATGKSLIIKSDQSEQSDASDQAARDLVKKKRTSKKKPEQSDAS